MVEGLSLLDYDKYTPENWVRKGVSKKVGNSKNTMLWHKVWYGRLCLKDVFPRLYSLYSEKKIVWCLIWVGGMVRCGGGSGGEEELSSLGRRRYGRCSMRLWLMHITIKIMRTVGCGKLENPRNKWLRR